MWKSATADVLEQLVSADLESRGATNAFSSRERDLPQIPWQYESTNENKKLYQKKPQTMC